MNSTTTKTTTTTRMHWTPESALRQASQSVWDSKNTGWFTPEAVAAKMVDLGCGVWHACHAVTIDAIASGAAEGYVPCRYCTGLTVPGQNGYHNMCKVRAERGHDVPVLDGTPQCCCSPCTKARKA